MPHMNMIAPRTQRPHPRTNHVPLARPHKCDECTIGSVLDLGGKRSQGSTWRSNSHQPLGSGSSPWKGQREKGPARKQATEEPCLQRRGMWACEHVSRCSTSHNATCDWHSQVIPYEPSTSQGGRRTMQLRRSDFALIRAHVLLHGQRHGQHLFRPPCRRVLVRHPCRPPPCRRPCRAHRDPHHHGLHHGLACQGPHPAAPYRSPPLVCAST